MTNWLAFDRQPCKSRAHSGHVEPILFGVMAGLVLAIHGLREGKTLMPAKMWSPTRRVSLRGRTQARSLDLIGTRSSLQQ